MKLDIQIYTWEDAPAFKERGSHGGDEDYVIVIPIEQAKVADEGWTLYSLIDALTVCDFNTFTQEIDGKEYKVWVTAHA